MQKNAFFQMAFSIKKLRAAGIGWVFLLLISCAENNQTQEPTLFTQLDSTRTNIAFINKLEPKKGKLSTVDYLYYYNGGGVAAGDINNDGLTDLFFVSNQQKNKLYLNKGNFKFEDITEKAGIEGFSDWNTGVTIADVNGDSWLDIYVCAVGNYMGLEGHNELYINNGDGTFTENAARYGLDFTGFSTQASFFDYDHDGDLDMYLLNHAMHLTRSYDRVLAKMLPGKAANDILFKNNNGRFEDVSKEAGVDSVLMAYGRGIAVADLDNDGWEDIYVTNDFNEPDYYFINNQDGTFSEKGRESFAHFSRYAMGCDIADINNDGFQDIMTLDMYPEDERVEKSSLGEDPLEISIYKSSYIPAGYHYQVNRNSLHLNTGGEKFSDIALLAGVAATDWSWSVLAADYDNDGYKDMFVTNGIAKKPTDLDYLKFAHEDSMKYSSQLFDYQIDRAIHKMPAGKANNYIFKGSNDLLFEDVSGKWGINGPTASNGAVYADLDNDGDLDLVTNNSNETAGIYKNKSDELVKHNFLKVQLKGSDKNTAGIGAKVFVKTKEGFQLQQLSLTRGFMSAVEPSLNFGLGKTQAADSVIVIWNDQKVQVMANVPANTTLTFKQTDAKKEAVSISLYAPERPIFEDASASYSIGYQHKENAYLDFSRESLIPFQVSQEGPKIAVGDVDRNGEEDFYVGGAKHQQGSLFLQKNGIFQLYKQEAFRADSVFEDVDALFLDVDNDKDLDLYVVSGGNEFYGKMEQQFDRLYLNDGKGNFNRAATALPAMYANKSCVRAIDFDKDGDMDLFVGGRVVAYGYGKIPDSYLLINDGKGKFKDQTATLAPELQKAGMITDAQWVDTDGDSDQDLVVAGDWMPVKVFRNDSGKLVEIENIVSPLSEDKNLHGLWQSLAAADFDKDGDMDLVAGNVGLNTKLRKHKEASLLKMYVQDLDHNKSVEQLIVYNRPDGKFYPLATKEELEKQIPPLANTKNFSTYQDFAGKTVAELFESTNIQLQDEKVINRFGSVYLENVGKNQFVVKLFPAHAQVSKVYTVYSEDLDEDGNVDILLAGNKSGVSPYQGKYDASYGVMLKGDGKGSFQYVPNSRIDLWLDGQVRDIKSIQTPQGKAYLVARNNDSLQIYRRKSHKLALK